MSTPARTLAASVAAITAVGLLDLIMDTRLILLAANAVALLALVGIVRHYHRTSAWWSSPVGRTTMGIKAGMLFMACAGMERRIAEQEAVAHGHALAQTLTSLGATLSASAWTAIAISVVVRFRVLTHLQRTGRSLPEPPKEDTNA